MKKIIKVKYTDFIENYTDEKFFPFILENESEAKKVLSLLEDHNKTVNSLYEKDKIRRKPLDVNYIDIDDKILKKEWYITPVETLEYDLISFEGEEYNKFLNDFTHLFEEKLDFKERMNRSIMFIKIKGLILNAEWSSFSGVVESFELVDLEENEENKFLEKIKDTSINNIFNKETSLPYHYLIYKE